MTWNKSNSFAAHEVGIKTFPPLEKGGEDGARIQLSQVQDPVQDPCQDLVERLLPPLLTNAGELNFVDTRLVIWGCLLFETLPLSCAGKTLHFTNQRQPLHIEGANARNPLSHPPPCI